MYSYVNIREKNLSKRRLLFKFIFEEKSIKKKGRKVDNSKKHANRYINKRFVPLSSLCQVYHL